MKTDNIQCEEIKTYSSVDIKQVYKKHKMTREAFAKWYRYNKRIVGRIFLSFLCAFAILYCEKVYRLNVQSGRDCLDYCLREEISYQKSILTFENFEIVNTGELTKRYSLDNTEIIDSSNTDKKYILVDCYIMKNEDSGEIDWKKIYMLTNTWYSQFDIELYEMINKEEMIISEGKDCYTIKVTIPFPILKMHMKNQWDNLLEEKYFIELPDYAESNYIRRIYMY